MPTFELEFGTIEVEVVAGIPGPPGSGGGSVDSVDARTGAVTLTDLYQPLDSDLTAIAALTTTSFGRAFLALANAAGARTAIGTVIGTDVEAHDPDLTTIAGLTPSNDDILQRKAGAWANRTIAQLATDLGLAASYQPLDSDLTAIAALTTTATGRSLLAAANAAAIQAIAGTVIGTNVQAWDADLDAIAALSSAADKLPYATGAQAWALTTLSSFVRTLLDDADAATARTTLGLTIGTNVQAFDSHYLLSNATANLTAGFNATDFSAGTKSSGTFTPDPANGNFQTATNGGAHTLAVPGSSCTIIIVYTNNGSAGTITTSGYTKVNGDSLDTTNAHIFLFYITKIGSSSLLTVKAMQ